MEDPHYFCLHMSTEQSPPYHPLALWERIHTNTHLFFQINHMITSPVQLIQIELMHAKHNQWKHYHFCCVEPALVRALSMERAGEKQRETVFSVRPTLLFEYLLNIC